ncbi:efflux RND transporter periplasmic adaptor subunit [Hahella ganghwensis]|uniref:efflux RND transporter periplasmic adaptor subunit n=1 Tax=Hahella ganghwensis TaxID=286420 RepID=UPI00037564B7|nr:efflux RND transporter periplasmic adaptor subunit [Hahella ganghwensis]
MIKVFRKSLVKASLIGSVILFLGVLVYLDDMESQALILPNKAAPALPSVSYIPVSPGIYQGSIRVMGEVSPRWRVTIKSQVSGEIVDIHSASEPGGEVAKGQWLMAVESSRYEAAVTAAELALASARVALRQAEVRTELAVSDWNNSGMTGQPGELALYKPQLALARKEVANAEKQLEAAKVALDYTRIRAPFDGIVVDRIAGLGQTVTEGEALLTLLDHRHLEMVVSLSREQWGRLAPKWEKAIVPLHDISGELRGQARISRGGAYLDQDTRQYRLHLDVVSSVSDKNILPGDFVSATLPGSVYEDAMLIPEGALTRDGLVWYIDKDNLLRSFRVTNPVPVDGHVIVGLPESGTDLGHVPEAASSWRIAAFPLASFMPGLPVKPVAESNTSDTIDMGVANLAETGDES